MEDEKARKVISDLASLLRQKGVISYEEYQSIFPDYKSKQKV